MKQYLSKDQTAKLIELGFERPKGWEYPTMNNRYVMVVPIDKDPEFNYSIGELIEMLNAVSELEIIRVGSGWGVGDDLRAFSGEELVDALYDMCLKLKEDGVI